jgi:hypothetical protein
VAGRGFTKNDDKNSPRIAIVNRELARKLFGSEIVAIGRHFKMPDGTRVEVVGIAEDGKYSSLTEDPHPAMFLPLTQWPAGPQWMVIRSGGDPQQLGEEIRRPLHQVDAGIPVEVEKRADELVTVLFGPEMATIALGVLGASGVILSITGIFGMAAYSVSKRLKELGLRVALGAQRKEVLRTGCAGCAFVSIQGPGEGPIHANGLQRERRTGHQGWRMLRAKSKSPRASIPQQRPSQGGRSPCR